MVAERRTEQSVDSQFQEIVAGEAGDSPILRFRHDNRIGDRERSSVHRNPAAEERAEGLGSDVD